MKKSVLLGTFLALAAAVFLLTLLGGSISRAAAAPQGTTIVVDSGLDLDTSKSTTCLSATPCTLRRAIVQARLAAAGDRPITITFNIPADPAEGYNAALNLWELHILTTTDPSVFRTLEGGQITIDGGTQPGGRTDGPKIILIGPSTGNKDGLIVGTNSAGGHDGNVLRGLGFQNFKNHVIVNSNDNLFEDNWFGLASDGLDVYLRNDDPQDGSGSSGLALSDGVMNNLMQNNVFLGFDGVAAAIRGEANIFTHNYVGTIADGSVPNKQTDPSLICTPVDWLGGGGLSLDGPDHLVEANVIAGLRQEIFVGSTQPDAIWVQSTCDACIIENNQIGIDALDNEVGVCGIGIDITNGEQIQVTDNVFADTFNSALFLNGALYDANTLRGNVVRRSTPWLHPTGSAKADNAILMYTGLPDPLEFFQPAQVTAVNGTAVSGTAGPGSPCPNCIIELFLDDTDAITEALQSLVVVTAAADGTWSATLPAPLTASQGIRTTSTTAQYNTIPNISAGTTVGLSPLYPLAPPEEEYWIYLPSISR
ncbi:MAG: hypothetical protein KC425_27225 [Anaerolineales bacterium]|nr:hypothetical protein [Anaerolineales bacterium]